jgi:hypothetical protein
VSEVTVVENKSIVGIDSLIATAVQAGSSIEQLTQLFDLKLRYEANEARKAFVEAMSAFRAVAPTIVKNGTGHNEKKYATLDNITKSINGKLAELGLSYGWVTEQTGPSITVHCDITHNLGHSLRTSLSAGPDASGSKNSIQAIGSTVTYLQRYTLLSALGLATGIIDDDGNGVGCSVTLSAEQVKELTDLLKESGANKQKFLEHFKSSSVELMSVTAFATAKAMLKTRISNKKKFEEASHAEA